LEVRHCHDEKLFVTHHLAIKENAHPIDRNAMAELAVSIGGGLKSDHPADFDLIGHVGFFDLYKSNIIRLGGLVNRLCTSLEIGSNDPIRQKF